MTNPDDTAPPAASTVLDGQDTAPIVETPAKAPVTVQAPAVQESSRTPQSSNVSSDKELQRMVKKPKSGGWTYFHETEEQD